MVFDEVIFDEVINPRFVAVCLKMEKNRPKGKKKDIREDNKNNIHRKHVAER